MDGADVAEGLLGHLAGAGEGVLVLLGELADEEAVDARDGDEDGHDGHDDEAEAPAGEEEEEDGEQHLQQGWTRSSRSAQDQFKIDLILILSCDPEPCPRSPILS